MKQFTLKRLCVAALLLAWLAVSANSPARGEDWPAWMNGSKDSKEFESQLSMARLNERHNQHDAAIKIYNAVIAKQPNNQLAHHRLAVIAASNGDFATADQHFAVALKSGPRTPDLLSDVSYSLFLQNRLDESEEALRRTLTEFPTHKKAHNTLGMVLGLKGRYEEALAEFRQVVGEAEAHANLAFVMVQVGDLEQASKHYHEAVRLDSALRPAAEALVQLNGYKPADSSTNAPKSAATSSNASTATASTSAPSRSTAKPTSTRQTVFTPKQPPSQQVATPSAKPSQPTTQSEPAAKAEILGDSSEKKVNPILEVAQPYAPQAPRVPTQKETNFAPAVIGLAKKDRLNTSVQDSSNALSEMMTKHNRSEGSISTPVTASLNEKSDPSSVTAMNAPASYQPAQRVAGIDTTPAPKIESSASNAEQPIRAQVYNYAAPPASQVSVSDEIVEAPLSRAEAEASDLDSGENVVAAEPAELPTVGLVPGAYALAAARAQADLLTETTIDAATQEPGYVAQAEIQAMPLPPVVADEWTPHATQIPVDISTPSGDASPASFITSSESIPKKISTEKAEEKSSETTAKILDSINSLLAGNPPAPWQIVVMTLAGTFGLVTVGKAARRLGRRKVSPQPVVEERPQASELAKPEVFEAEETYTYLESQVREVCAGLPSRRRSAARIR